MNTFLQDVRYALRMLARSPGFTAVAVATLALGIGANTALFSIVNGVLLSPLSYPQAGQLVAIYGHAPGFDKAPMSYPNFLDWQKSAQAFSSMAIYRSNDYFLTGEQEGERLSGYMISAEFFPTMGVQPILGRIFRHEDNIVGAAPVVVLGGGLWKRKFGGSPDVVGKTITLNGGSYLIVGVIPASFNFYGVSNDVYTPIGQWNDPSFHDRRISVSAHAVGRLRPGVTFEQAQPEMDAIARNLAAAYPDADKDLGITLVPLKDDYVGNVRPYLWLLLGAVGFLMLIACTNVANLLLARATGRSREFAIRAALGAKRTRIIRQLLTESVLLAAVGGILGVLLAYWGTTALIARLPSALPRASNVSIDLRVLVFGITLSLLAGVIFGLAPALKTSAVNLLQVINAGGRGGSEMRHRLQGVFAASEIAMALVLLVGAGLMLRTLAALWQVDPGFNPRHAITFNLSLAATPHTTSAETRARLRQFDDRMLAIPGVQAVSVTLGSRPMIHDSALPFWIEGEPKPAHDNDMPQAMFYLAESGFQQAMGLRLLRGRFIDKRDDERSPIVIDIDDDFARTYFPNQDPIGRHVNLTQFNVQAEIVGIVGHVKQWGPTGASKAGVEAQFFYPFMQTPEKLMPMISDAVAVVLRTQGDPGAVMADVRRSVQQMDAREVIYNVQTMEDVWSSALTARRLSMILLIAFASLALVLACIGIYGVISYVVGQRTREIGVRVALGAHRRDILRLVLQHGARMALAGSAVGIAASLALTRLMSNQLFGVTAHDPLTFAVVAALLIVVALAACYVPARRATRVDPMVALRYE